MDFEAIGVRAVAWRNSEADKAAKRKLFIAAHIAAIEDHGTPCQSVCKYPSHCAIDHGEECARKAAIHAQTKPEYDAWIAASRTASADKGALTRFVKREQQKDAERDSEALRANDGQSDLFES